VLGVRAAAVRALRRLQDEDSALPPPGAAGRGGEAAAAGEQDAAEEGDGSEPPCPVLSRLAWVLQSDPAKEVRAAAVHALAVNPSTLPLLATHATQDAAALVRRAAFVKIGVWVDLIHWQPDQARRLLARGLCDTDAEVRREACLVAARWLGQRDWDFPSLCEALGCPAAAQAAQAADSSSSSSPERGGSADGGLGCDRAGEAALAALFAFAEGPSPRATASTEGGGAGAGAKQSSARGGNGSGNGSGGDGKGAARDPDTADGAEADEEQDAASAEAAAAAATAPERRQFAPASPRQRVRRLSVGTAPMDESADAASAPALGGSSQLTNTQEAGAGDEEGGDAAEDELPSSQSMTPRELWQQVRRALASCKPDMLCVTVEGAFCWRVRVAWLDYHRRRCVDAQMPAHFEQQQADGGSDDADEPTAAAGSNTGTRRPRRSLRDLSLTTASTQAAAETGSAAGGRRSKSRGGSKPRKQKADAAAASSSAADNVQNAVAAAATGSSSDSLFCPLLGGGGCFPPPFGASAARTLSALEDALDGLLPGPATWAKMVVDVVTELGIRLHLDTAHRVDGDDSGFGGFVVPPSALAAGTAVIMDPEDTEVAIALADSVAMLRQWFLLGQFVDFSDEAGKREAIQALLALLPHPGFPDALLGPALAALANVLGATAAQESEQLRGLQAFFGRAGDVLASLVAAVKCPSLAATTGTAAAAATAQDGSAVNAAQQMARDHAERLREQLDDALDADDNDAEVARLRTELAAAEAEAEALSVVPTAAAATATGLTSGGSTPGGLLHRTWTPYVPLDASTPRAVALDLPLQNGRLWVRAVALSLQLLRGAHLGPLQTLYASSLGGGVFAGSALQRQRVLHQAFCIPCVTEAFQALAGPLAAEANWDVPATAAALGVDLWDHPWLLVVLQASMDVSWGHAPLNALAAEATSLYALLPHQPPFRRRNATGPVDPLLIPRAAVSWQLDLLRFCTGKAAFLCARVAAVEAAATLCATFGVGCNPPASIVAGGAAAVPALAPHQSAPMVLGALLKPKALIPGKPEEDAVPLPLLLAVARGMAKILLSGAIPAASDIAWEGTMRLYTTYILLISRATAAEAAGSDPMEEAMVSTLGQLAIFFPTFGALSIDHKWALTSASISASRYLLPLAAEINRVIVSAADSPVALAFSPLVGSAAQQLQSTAGATTADDAADLDSDDRSVRTFATAASGNTTVSQALGGRGGGEAAATSHALSVGRSIATASYQMALQLAASVAPPDAEISTRPSKVPSHVPAFLLSESEPAPAMSTSTLAVALSLVVDAVADIQGGGAGFTSSMLPPLLALQSIFIRCLESRASALQSVGFMLSSLRQSVVVKLQNRSLEGQVEKLSVKLGVTAQPVSSGFASTQPGAFLGEVLKTRTKAAAEYKPLVDAAGMGHQGKKSAVGSMPPGNAAGIRRNVPSRSASLVSREKIRASQVSNGDEDEEFDSADAEDE
jgi:hypothetical protein